MRLAINPSGLVWPRAGYGRRIKAYLAEMYPVPARLALAALTYFGTVTLLGKIHGFSQLSFPPLHLVGIASLFSLMLIIRLMDEIKDKEIDRELFPHRPLPTGRVLETDINVTIAVLTLLYLLINLAAGRAFWIALWVLGYAFLMFKHFFIPRILQKSLLITLATHNPIVAMTLFYVLALFAAVSRVPWSHIDWPSSLLLILMNWALLFAWEIARKIRCHEEETAYVTYSQLWGRLGAVLVAGGAQTLTFVIGLCFAWTLPLSPAFIVLWSSAYAVPVVAYGRFLRDPTPLTAKLGRYAEFYMLAVLSIQTLEVLWPS